MLVRADLGSPGIAYVRSYLQANGEFGKRLGPLLMASHDLDRGVAWAFVPAVLPAGRRAPLTDFEVGGLFPAGDPAWSEQVGGWLDSLRSRSATSRIVCAGGALERPSDPFVKKLRSPVWLCGESVLFHAPLGAPRDVLTRDLGGATWRPDVGVVTDTLGDSELNQHEIDEAALAGLAANARAVVVGAWDDEGLVFWEPDARE